MPYLPLLALTAQCAKLRLFFAPCIINNAHCERFSLGFDNFLSIGLPVYLYNTYRLQKGKTLCFIKFLLQSLTTYNLSSPELYFAIISVYPPMYCSFITICGTVTSPLILNISPSFLRQVSSSSSIFC